MFVETEKKQAAGAQSTAPKEDRASGQDLKAGEIIDLRYRVRSTIGRGGMGAVYLVDDLQENRVLALKQIRRDRSDPKSVSILKNEFLAMAPLVHPNLARVFNFGCDWRTGEYYFTSEYVRGQQLLKATSGYRIEQREDLLRLLEIMVQTLRALEFVHSRGLVHGDLKPENLMVSRLSDGRGGAVERIKIIDFGLTKREKDFGGKKIFGTAFYIAPETVLGSQVDRRTDLYSLGIVFYQILTRRLPFSGPSNLAVLKGHLEDVPAPPDAVLPAIPGPLSRFVLKLMEKRPADRFPSAVAAIEALNTALETSFSLETPQSMRSYLAGGRLVGRESTLRELQQFLVTHFRLGALSTDEELNLSFLRESHLLIDSDETAPPPAGRFFLIRGEEGIGKSSLVAEFKRFVEVRNVPFIPVEVREPGDREQTTLRHLLETLSRVFSADEERREDTLLALLTSILEKKDLPEAGRDRISLEGVAANLVKACETIPIVLFFSRLDLAEESLLKFLRLLVRVIVEEGQERSKILLLATARDEELEAPALRRLLLSPEIRSHFRELSLERLTPDELQEVVEGMFGRRQFSPAFFHRLYEESDGNPGVFHEILRHFIDTGKLERTVEGWRHTGDIKSDPLPGKVRRELRSRIQRLDSHAMRLGVAFAVFGNGCELEVAARLAYVQPGKIVSGIVTLKRERLLREDGEGATDRFSFTHRSARQLFLDCVSPGDLAKIHLRAGQLLEERVRAGFEVDPRRLAYHFLRAGQSDSGVRYGLMAARTFARRQLPRKALELYREVRQLCTDGLGVSVRDLEYQIAMLEATVGNTRESATILTRLLAEVGSGEAGGGSKITRADVLTDLGIMECRLGRFDRSGRYFHRAYESFKQEGNSPGLLRLLLGFATLFHYRAEFAESAKYCDRVEGALEKLPSDLSRGSLFLLQAENQHLLGSHEAAIEYCRRSLRLLDHMREAGAVALSLFNLGKFYVFQGKLEKAQRQFQLCARVYRRIGVKDFEADSLREYGTVQLMLESPARAASELTEALELYESTGHLWGCIESLKLLGECYRRMGRYEEAESFLDRAERLNASLGNARLLWEIHGTQARIRLDRGDIDGAARSLERVEKIHQSGWVDQEQIILGNLELQCRVALHRDDYRRALDLTALGRIHARDVRLRTRIAPLLELRARVYMQLGRETDVRRVVRELADVGEKYNLPVLVARAQAFEARVFQREGDAGAAAQLFEKALAVFQERESERDLADLYLEYGSALLENGDQERAYLLFEEGAYLAKKMNLARLRCQYFMATARLETTYDESRIAAARNHLGSAEKLARKHKFDELLWRILYAVARLHGDAGASEEARTAVTEALRRFRRVASGVPPNYLQSYRRATGADDLLELHAELCGEAGD